MFNAIEIGKVYNQASLQLKREYPRRGYPNPASTKKSYPYALHFNAHGNNRGFEIVDDEDKAVKLSGYEYLSGYEGPAQAFEDLYLFLSKNTPYTLGFNRTGKDGLTGFEVIGDKENKPSESLADIKSELANLGVDITFIQASDGSVFVDDVIGEENIRKYMHDTYDR